MKIGTKPVIYLTQDEIVLLKNAYEFFSNFANEMNENNITIDGWDSDDMMGVCCRIDSIFDRME